MIRITVDAKEAISGLERTQSNLKNCLLTALAYSTALARGTVIDNIRHGMQKGLGWPPFTPATIRRKAKRGRSLEGLVDTGRMMGATHETVSKTRLEGTVYPGTDYLKYHEFGTRKMGKRPVMAPVPKQINSKIMEIFKSEIARAVG